MNPSPAGGEQLAVVIPMLNEAPGVEATLRALARQRDTDFAVVVVDNGSTDGSAEVVGSFIERHALTTWRVIAEPQKGTGAAADTGFRAAIEAGASIVARTDADCLPRPDWTAAVRRALTPSTSALWASMMAWGSCAKAPSRPLIDSRAPSERLSVSGVLRLGAE